LTVGAHKGSGLSIIVDVLAGAMSTGKSSNDSSRLSISDSKKENTSDSSPNRLHDADFCNTASGWKKGVVEKNAQDRRRRI
jgi:hypothetical protein